MVKKKKKKNQKSNCKYYLQDLEKQRKISLFFCILSTQQTNQKKEERNIEKEIQNQPPYSGGV